MLRALKLDRSRHFCPQNFLGRSETQETGAVAERRREEEEYEPEVKQKKKKNVGDFSVWAKGKGSRGLCVSQRKRERVGGGMALETASRKG